MWIKANISRFPWHMKTSKGIYSESPENDICIQYTLRMVLSASRDSNGIAIIIKELNVNSFGLHLIFIFHNNRTLEQQPKHSNNSQNACMSVVSFQRKNHNNCAILCFSCCVKMVKTNNLIRILNFIVSTLVHHCEKVKKSFDCKCDFLSAHFNSRQENRIC